MWSDVIVALAAQRKRLEKYGRKPAPNTQDVPEPVPFEARVCVWCWLLMLAIIGVSFLAGWLWPLE